MQFGAIWRVILRDVDGVEGFERACRLTNGAAKGCEIVVADQVGGPGAHGVGIEGLAHLPDEAIIERCRRAAHQQAEQVAPFRGGKPGVPVIPHARRVHDGDRRGFEVVIQRLGQAKGCPGLGRVTMGHLTQGMHARIGTPRRGNLVRAGFNFAKRGFDCALDCRQIRLALPALEGVAVVFDFQSIAWHGGELRGSVRSGKARSGKWGAASLSYGQQANRRGAGSVVIGALAEGVTRRVEAVGDQISGAFFEPVVRVGVTGLARAGKTVFITSFVANMTDRARMTQLVANAEGRIEAAFLQPQPDDTVPRFDYETHLDALSGPNPHWPSSTRAVSELRLSLRLRPGGMLSALQGPRVVHLDIVDYPGEWLLDLGLLDQTYAEWSAEVLGWAQKRAAGAAFIAAAEAAQGRKSWEEPEARALADAYRAYLVALRDAGHMDITPGRFLLPGELEGSPVLTFAPLPPEDNAPRRGLWREMERRFEAYKSRVVQPFFHDHFSRIDRQVVLVDVLGAIHKGPQAVDELRRAMAGILGAFRPGRNAFLSRILRGKRVEKILFCATKADHLHHSQHARLTAIMEALVREATDRAAFAGARTDAMSIAALRATVEETVTHAGQTLECVRGTLLSTGKQAALYPGELPVDPAQLLTPARTGAEKWLDGDYNVMAFAPAPLRRKPGEGPPHIRLDRAAQFLIGDKL